MGVVLLFGLGWAILQLVGLHQVDTPLDDHDRGFSPIRSRRLYAGQPIADRKETLSRQRSQLRRLLRDEPMKHLSFRLFNLSGEYFAETFDIKSCKKPTKG